MAELQQVFLRQRGRMRCVISIVLLMLAVSSSFAQAPLLMNGEQSISFQFVGAFGDGDEAGGFGLSIASNSGFESGASVTMIDRPRDNVLGLSLSAAYYPFRSSVDTAGVSALALYTGINSTTDNSTPMSYLLGGGLILGSARHRPVSVVFGSSVIYAANDQRAEDRVFFVLEMALNFRADAAIISIGPSVSTGDEETVYGVGFSVGLLSKRTEY